MRKEGIDCAFQRLPRAVVRDDGKVFRQTRALDVESVQDRQLVVTDRGRIRADAVVVAANTPFNNRLALHTKQAA